MEKNATLNKWIAQMEKDFSSSSLFNFDTSSQNNLRIMQEEFIELLNTVISGETFEFVNLEKSSESESYDINQYRKSESYTGKQLFTNLSLESQNQTLNNIFSLSQKNLKETSISNTYLCFGLLRYKLNPLASSSIEAPLILVPVDIKYNESTKTYRITGAKREVLVNEPLITKMQKERKLDLSQFYTIESI